MDNLLCRLRVVHVPLEHTLNCKYQLQAVTYVKIAHKTRLVMLQQLPVCRVPMESIIANLTTRLPKRDIHLLSAEAVRHAVLDSTAWTAHLAVVVGVCLAPHVTERTKCEWTVLRIRT